ncbi:hypothetical protein HAX54_048233 [Datura stramonium]|uniref:Uncharacterized protein n=1 Tax=Datura stramonium TaxID=4076 RepID=A0ABS8WMV0_DATST|nr:hypothetical protein [Datura stramonium]
MSNAGAEPLRRDSDLHLWAAGQSDPPPTKRNRDIHVSPMTNRHVPPQGSYLLKMVQMARTYNSQILKLAKVIPHMIQSSIKMAMKPVVEKLSSLCARVDVLEREVTAMRDEIERWKELIPPMEIDLNNPVAGPDSQNRSPLDDWCVGYNPTEIATIAEGQDSEPPHIKCALYYGCCLPN